MIEFFFVIISFLVAIYAIYRWNNRRLYQLISKVPGEDGLPFIGILYKYAKGFGNLSKYFEITMSFPEKYGTPSKVWYGPRAVVFIDKPEDLKFIMNSQDCISKPAFFYDAFVFKKGLVLANNELWKNHRKVLNSAFTPQAIQEQIPFFDEKIKLAVKMLQRKVDCGEFNLYDHAAACSLETLLKGSFNFEDDQLTSPEQSKLLHMVDESKVLMTTLCFSMWLKFKPLYRVTKLYREITEKFFKVIFPFLHKVVEANQQAPAVESSRKVKNVIEQILDPKNGFTPKEIRDECGTFFFAGHETSALTISAAIMLLAMHKDVRDKVLDEIDQVTGMNEGMLDYETLHKLTYLEMVIKETMRVAPVLPIVIRETSKEIKIGDYLIPNGTILMIPIYLLHRNTKYWGQDAHLFRPERFSADEIKNVHQYAFIPFTGGPRICIGWRYGMLFVKTYIVNILRNFKVHTNLKYEDIKFEMGPSMSFIQKYMVSLERRTTE